jgi:uncharacterized protein with HEPN domain
MRDHAQEALALAAGRSAQDLDADRTFALALTKLVEIIGEAAGRVSTQVQDAHPEIPWRQIVGTRNRLVHGYDAVDHEILWKIVSDELPELVAKIHALLADNPEKTG